MLNNLFGSSQIIISGLNKSWNRNQVISDNIANSETDGYKAKDVFVNELNSFINNDTVSFSVQERTDGIVKPNGNNVDMEKEMTSLVENSIEYNALIQALTRELRKIEYVINEGR
ncbi:MAG: hypothetical protein JXQ23_14105 [Clostridia bacterium]|nr:hypothetical protein [Clostridia bacterium]